MEDPFTDILNEINETTFTMFSKPIDDSVGLLNIGNVVSFKMSVKEVSSI